MHNLPRIVAETPIGQEVPVTVWRDGHETTVQTKVGELPDDQKQVAAVDAKAPAKPTEISALGLKLAPIDQEARDKYSARRRPEGRRYHRRRAERPGVGARPEAGRRDRGSAATIGELAVRGAGPARQRAQAEPQIRADADPGPGRPPLGAAAAERCGDAEAGLAVRALALTRGKARSAMLGRCKMHRPIPGTRASVAVLSRLPGLRPVSGTACACARSLGDVRAGRRHRCAGGRRDWAGRVPPALGGRGRGHPFGRRGAAGGRAVPGGAGHLPCVRRPAGLDDAQCRAA